MIEVVTGLRPLRANDVEAVVAIYRRAFGGARPIDAAEILAWLESPDLGEDNLRVLEENGRVVGYGDVSIGDEYVALEVAAPGRWGVFLDWAEATGRKRAVSRVRVADYAPDSGLAGTAAARGYRQWRSAFTMRTDFTDAPPQPGAALEGVVVDTFRDQDGDQLREAINEVFRPDPFFDVLSPERFRTAYLGHRDFDPSLWLLAHHATELVGFVLAFPEALAEPGIGWVESLGVRSRWRGRGIGESLLRSALHALHARGLHGAALGVDGSNETGAARLYERAGMRVIGRIDNWALDL
ncbi:MAG TPA: GNAT family N-acetyltransferase [Gaiellaceae bacterium]|jgi:ribosomal protein S18 acetylase RimI-like enzyme